jgi:hypothetical protein
VLVVALALVGGTGCITTAIVQNVQQKNRMREAEEARQKSIARLTPLADAGDAASGTALAREMMSVPGAEPVDQIRVFALLSGAADKGYAPAQALLGEMLVLARVQTTTYRELPIGPGLRDRERGFQLLRQAASRACGYARFPDKPYFSPIRPAWLLSVHLGSGGHADEAQVWRARSLLHCNEPNTENLTWRIMAKNAKAPERTQSLAMLLLTQDQVDIAKAEGALPAEEVDAARRGAEQLRRAVAQSEQQYPAPSRKEM